MTAKVLAVALAAWGLAAQEPAASVDQQGWPQAEAQASAADFVVETGTRVPLSLINSISTKQAAEGDRVYLESVFPILVNGRIAIPPGSYVAGTVTSSKRAGRVKGRSELFIRFDSLTLPNGVTRDFRAGIGGLDGRASEELDRAEGKIKGEGNKAGDARTVGETSAAGATIGAIAGRNAMGAGIGAAAGAAAGLVGVLLGRGPDAVLARGTTVEMVLDRPLHFSESELDFSSTGGHRARNQGPGPEPAQKSDRPLGVGRRLPAGRF